MGKHSVSKKHEHKHRASGSAKKKSVREGKLVKQRKIGRDSSIAASPPDRPKKARKAHKWKAGTLAAMEVKRYQTGKKATCPLITKQAIEDLMRDTLGECGDDYRIQKRAILAMREAVEDEAVRLFESSRVLAVHAKRKTIDVKDMRAVARVRKIYPGSSDASRTNFFHGSVGGGGASRKKKEKKAVVAASDASPAVETENTATELTTADEITTSDD